MENTKFKKALLPIGFIILFVGIAITVMDSSATGKVHDFFKGFLVGLGITLVISSFILMRLKKQQLN